jgi:NAD(P)H-dependent FMN reductase
MTSPKKKAIAVIIGSVREPRVGPEVTSLVLDILNAHEPIDIHHHPDYDLQEIDLKDHPLPLFDEPVIPAHVPTKMNYVHSHTKKWSETIARFDAFIFVTPQYNWGYPASLKNAIDYLFNEWKGKYAMIVSYGTRGGGLASGQLKQVLEGVRMKVVETRPALPFGGGNFTWTAMTKGELAEGVKERWERENGDEIVKAFEELKELLSEQSSGKSENHKTREA